ncbi:hypothetical protein ACQ4PT_050658 [Festuca glaucescens]
MFDLHLGSNYWLTVPVDNATSYGMAEAVFTAWASWVPVCLVNTGTGTPFVNTVELRHLGALYPDVVIDQPMNTFGRVNMGGTDFQRQTSPILLHHSISRSLSLLDPFLPMATSFISTGAFAGGGTIPESVQS